MALEDLWSEQFNFPPDSPDQAIMDIFAPTVWDAIMGGTVPTDPELTDSILQSLGLQPSGPLGGGGSIQSPEGLQDTVGGASPGTPTGASSAGASGQGGGETSSGGAGRTITFGAPSFPNPGASGGLGAQGYGGFPHPGGTGPSPFAPPPAAAVDPWVAAALGGGAGLLSGLLGTPGQHQTPVMPTGMRAAADQAFNTLQLNDPYQRALGLSGFNILNTLGPQFAGGTTPLQAQQAGILGALFPGAQAMARGDMASVLQNPVLQKTIQTAYQPYIGAITQQAIDAARSRGFAGGADLLGGAAAPFANQALANLPGMQAQTALDYSLKLPQAAANLAGAYNQPINQQGNFALQFANASMQPQLNQSQNWMNLMRSYPTGQNTQGGGSIGGGAMGALGGAASGYMAAINQQNQAQNLQNQNAWLNLLSQAGPWGMSQAYGP